jgi:hypothetical protein
MSPPAEQTACESAIPLLVMRWTEHDILPQIGRHDSLPQAGFKLLLLTNFCTPGLLRTADACSSSPSITALLDARAKTQKIEHHTRGMSGFTRLNMSMLALSFSTPDGMFFKFS